MVSRGVAKLMAFNLGVKDTLLIQEGVLASLQETLNRHTCVYMCVHMCLCTDAAEMYIPVNT